MQIKNSNLPWKYQSPLALAGGSQGTRGAPANHKLTNYQIKHVQTPIILYK